MPKQKVLVTNSTTDAGVSAIQALAQADYEVIATDFHRLPFGVRSRYCRANYVLSNSEELAFEKEFLDIVDHIRPDVLLPIGTRAVMAVIRQQEKFSARTAVSVPDHEAVKAAYNKRICMAECRSLGIPCPPVYALDEALKLFDRTDDEFVVVVKPDVDIGAAAGVRFIRDADQLQHEVRACTREFGGALIQQYIPGEVDAMKTAVLLFSPESHPTAAFTTQKIRQWPSTGGVTAVSRSTADHEIVKQVLPFFEKWRWRGVAEVEFKFDHRDGLHKVIEINPRFPGYLRFLRHCGLDVPVMAARLALQNSPVSPVQFPAYTVGEKYINPGLFARSVMDDMRGGGISISSLRKAMDDMQGSTRLMLSMFSDPLPMIGRGLSDLRKKDRPSLFRITV